MQRCITFPFIGAIYNFIAGIGVVLAGNLLIVGWLVVTAIQRLAGRVNTWANIESWSRQVKRYSFDPMRVERKFDLPPHFVAPPHDKQVVLFGPHPNSMALLGQLRAVSDLFPGRRIVMTARRNHPIAACVWATRGAVFNRDDCTEAQTTLSQSVSAITEPSVFIIYCDGSRPSPKRRTQLETWFKSKGRQMPAWLKHTLWPRPSGLLTLTQALPSNAVYYCIDTRFNRNATSMWQAGQMAHATLWVTLIQTRRPPTNRSELKTFLVSLWESINYKAEQRHEQT